MYVSIAIDSLDAPLIAIVHSCNILCLSKSNPATSPGFRFFYSQFSGQFSRVSIKICITPSTESVCDSNSRVLVHGNCKFYSLSELTFKGNLCFLAISRRTNRAISLKLAPVPYHIFVNYILKFSNTAREEDLQAQHIPGKFSHEVTKIQTKKLSILLRFYFQNVLEQLKTNFHTNFRFKGFLVL